MTSPQNRPELLDQFRFHHHMAEVPGPAIVIFTGPACGSCRAWKQMLEKLQQRHSHYSIFEVDAERDPALAAEFSIFHLPALFLYRDGHYHAAIQCEASIASLESTLNHLLREGAQEIP